MNNYITPQYACCMVHMTIHIIRSFSTKYKYFEAHAHHFQTGFIFYKLSVQRTNDV